jgi:hypothetical protein
MQNFDKPTIDVKSSNILSKSQVARAAKCACIDVLFSGFICEMTRFFLIGIRVLVAPAYDFVKINMR